MRIDEDHGIVRGASPKRTGARIQHPIHSTPLPGLPVVGVAFLFSIVAVMAYKEVPLHSFVFRREGVETWHVIVLWKPVLAAAYRIGTAGGFGISPSLQQHYRVPSFRKPRRHGAAPSAGTHDNVFNLAL